MRGLFHKLGFRRYSLILNKVGTDLILPRIFRYNCRVQCDVRLFIGYGFTEDINESTVKYTGPMVMIHECTW